MSWECERYGQKLRGNEKFYPEFDEKTIYKCKDCGKIKDNGKHSFCPVCSTERVEKKGYAWKKVGGVAVVGSVAVAVITKGNFGGGKA